MVDALHHGRMTMISHHRRLVCNLFNHSMFAVPPRVPRLHLLTQGPLASNPHDRAP